MSQPQTPPIFDLPKVLAIGIASPAATVITSRFGVAGTLLGLALSAVIITVAADFLKVYLARIPGAVTTIPGGLKEKSFFRRVFERIKIPFSKFASLPRTRRRSILIRSVVAAGTSFIVGLMIITALEFGVGKSLSCSVWGECSTESSSAESSSRIAGASNSSTLPSILGGGQSVGSSLPQVNPSNPQRQPGVHQRPDFARGTLGVPSQGPPPAATDRSAQPGQWQGPSDVPKEEYQQQDAAGQSRGSADNSEG